MYLPGRIEVHMRVGYCSLSLSRKKNQQKAEEREKKREEEKVKHM